jgi:DNA-binding MarR family transcriptional regulator/N-acetylglutamate synthase-like GNAT family acetyltransferase
MESSVEAIREFNRFYTQKMGILRAGLLDSPFSLTEARILYELAHHADLAAVDLVRDLGLDPGYVSRILRSFERKGLISRAKSTTDARQSLLRLTQKGRAALMPLEDCTRQQLGQMLAGLSREEVSDLRRAMGRIQALLDPTPSRPGASFLLRPHRPGDLGWIVQRHAMLYTEEHGWDMSFEGLVAEIVAKFVASFDPRRECCWIAEQQGRNVGSVAVVKAAEDTAQLRLLLVEPEARGLGIGKRLVEEAIAFSRRAGYRRVILWTNDILIVARHIYEQAGFHLMGEETHRSFGRDLVGQFWALDLDGPIGQQTSA